MNVSRAHIYRRQPPGTSREWRPNLPPREFSADLSALRSLTFLTFSRPSHIYIYIALSLLARHHRAHPRRRQTTFPTTATHRAPSTTPASASRAPLATARPATPSWALHRARATSSSSISSPSSTGRTRWAWRISTTPMPSSRARTMAGSHRRRAATERYSAATERARRSPAFGKHSPTPFLGS